MNLLQAFEHANTQREELSPAKRKKGQTRLYREIRRIGEPMRSRLGGDFDADDVIQNTFLKLRKTTSECDSESGVRGLIRSALKSVFLDLCEKRKRSPLTILDAEDDDETGHSVQRQDQSASADERFERSENTERSDILDAPETARELRRQVCDYFNEIVLPLRYSRKTYLQNAREQVDEMFCLSEGDTNWRQLVDEEVEQADSESERNKVRNRIQKRHSRTRKKIRSVLESVRDETGEYEELSAVTDFDLRLLLQTLDSLRQRDRSSDS